MTWEEIKQKYPEKREEMSREREQEFVDDCFSCYENEGFAKKYWSPYDEYKDRVGQSFEVLGRCTPGNKDLCVLPMWNIKFEDGTLACVYPEEIIPSEMRNNGCSLDGIE